MIDLVKFFGLAEADGTFPHKIPVKGDKVFLLDAFYGGLSDGVEAAKLARLDYVTVDESTEIIIGGNGRYENTYEIYIQESKYLVGLYGISWVYYKR